ncbi:MAG: response regulator, partial [Bdellovibrionales bacterium]|nr:response regulator [Bdellovibrionales bacterium]
MFDKNTRFLVVDDLKTIRSLMKDILKKLGFSQINEAEDGQKALNMLKDAAGTDSPFGFIISDWNMPNKTGLSLLEDCLKDEDLKSIPFLMVTIESEREYVLRAIQMGVSDFVVKPFT